MNGAPELGDWDVRKGLVRVLRAQHLQGPGQFLEELLAAGVCDKPFGLVPVQPFVPSPVVPRYPGEELRTMDGLKPVRGRPLVVLLPPV